MVAVCLCWGRIAPYEGGTAATAVGSGGLLVKLPSNHFSASNIARVRAHGVSGGWVARRTRCLSWMAASQMMNLLLSCEWLSERAPSRALVVVPAAPAAPATAAACGACEKEAHLCVREEGGRAIKEEDEV